MNGKGLSIAALLLALLALGVSIAAWRNTAAQGAPREALLATLQQQRAEREALLAALAPPAGQAAPPGLIADYLGRIRASSVPAQAVRRQQLDALERNLNAMLATARAYEPLATGADFKPAVVQLADHVAQWSDRWDNVMEVFMAGGNLPAADPAFPAHWREVLEREAAAD
ncbi:MAG: hypothetical protein RL026_1174 [Pseudomonadota bacterium]